MTHDARYTTPDYSGIAPCCKEPDNRRTATLDPVQVAKAVGGVPGLQVCAVCGRKHYTFSPDPIGTARTP